MEIRIFQVNHLPQFAIIGQNVDQGEIQMIMIREATTEDAVRLLEIYGYYV